jgi:hypothetical protein
MTTLLSELSTNRCMACRTSETVSANAGPGAIRTTNADLWRFLPIVVSVVPLTHCFRSRIHDVLAS